MVIPASSVSWDELHWYALHTKSRHEKVVEEGLRKRGIETFLPLRKLTRHWSDRVKQIEEPIFRGYLFVQIPLKKQWEVLRAHGSVRLVGFNSGPVPISEKELEAVRRFIQDKISIDPFPYLSKGDRVYIRSGPLQGIEGFIARKDRHTRLVISLDLLMQSISVEVDEAVVEKI